MFTETEVIEPSARPTGGREPTRRVGLPRLGAPESLWVRLLYVGLAVGFCALFFWGSMYFWTASHPGVDQNGYLVGGRQFAKTLSMGLTPPDPFGFVGRMWIGTPSQTYYPKYPLGLPFIYALGFWTAGEHGVDFAHLVSPISLALALAGCFFLIRLVVPSFYALLGTMIMATSPVTLWCLNNPNSHASTLACVVWGMYLVIRWWQDGGLWRARGAGLLVGYAATIRYTEGLLVLPLLLVVLFKAWPTLRRRRDEEPAGAAVDGSPRREGLVLLAWWALPIAVLVTFNLFWFGDLTGYDSTNESTGFSYEYFLDNWEPMLRQFHTSALFFTLPLGVMGAAFLFAWSKRLALVLAAWVLPSVLLYTAYYWAPDGGLAATNTGYMRFFLTVMPALVLGAMWFVRYVASQAAVSPRAAILTTSALVALLAIVNVLAWDLTSKAAGWLKMTDATLFTAGLDRPGWMLLRFGAYGLVIAAVAGLVWFVQHHWVSQETDATQAAGIVIGALAATFAGTVQLYNAAPTLERDFRSRLSLEEGGKQVRRQVPEGSLILASANVLHHLQFIGDYRLYDPGQFSASYIRRLEGINPDEPEPLQPQRAQYLVDLFKGESDTRLQQRLNGIVRRALNWDQKVYYVGTRNTINDWRRRIDQARRGRRGEWTEQDDRDTLAALVLRGPTGARDLQATIVDRWSEAPLVQEETPGSRRPRGAASRRPQRWSAAGEWVLVEITPKPPPPPPPPATRPSTAPAR